MSDTRKLSEKIRLDAGWGYSDQGTNELVDSVRALEAELEAVRGGLSAALQVIARGNETQERLKAERDAIRLDTLRECLQKTEESYGAPYFAIQALIDAEVGK